MCSSGASCDNAMFVRLFREYTLIFTGIVHTLSIPLRPRMRTTTLHIHMMICKDKIGIHRVPSERRPRCADFGLFSAGTLQQSSTMAYGMVSKVHYQCDSGAVLITVIA
jgi:hypothetical protein